MRLRIWAAAPVATVRRANGVGDLAAALQDDDDDKEMHDQHHEAQQRGIAAAAQPEQQRHVRKGDAGHADGDDAPDPDLDIGCGLGANPKQAVRPGQRPRGADQRARQRIAIDDRLDGKPDRRAIADLGTQQHRGDADEDQHRQQFEREPPQHERQPDQRLPGPRQAETPPMQRRLHGDVSGGGWRIDHRQRLRRRTRGLRQPRFQQRHRPLDQAEHQPFGGEGAAEHQRQFPGDVEDLAVGRGIVGGSQEPIIERRKMRHRPHQIGDFARDIADLFGDRQQQLRAKAIRGERDGRLCFGRGLGGLRR